LLACIRLVLGNATLERLSGYCDLLFETVKLEKCGAEGDVMKGSFALVFINPCILANRPTTNRLVTYVFGVFAAENDGKIPTMSKFRQLVEAG
jgi:hypothetical protein